MFHSLTPPFLVVVELEKIFWDVERAKFFWSFHILMLHSSTSNRLHFLLTTTTTDPFWEKARTRLSYLPSVFTDLAKFRHFGKTLQVFGKFWTVYFLLCKMLSLLLNFWYIIGLTFVVANGQILKNNLTIWSHWMKIYLFKREIEQSRPFRYTQRARKNDVIKQLDQ